jgi:hypothetical protein
VHGPVGLVVLFELPHPLAMSATTTAMSVHRVTMMDRLRIGVFNVFAPEARMAQRSSCRRVGVLASVSSSIPSAYPRTV